MSAQEDSPGGKAPEQKAQEAPPEAPTTEASSAEDPLRGSRASGMWAAMVLLVVVLVLVSVFVMQNTQSVTISYFGWTGQAPLAAALLIAVASGLLLAVSAGSIRLLQVRRRVRREQKRSR